MMLGTLFPEYEVEFGRATTKAVRSMSRDPLFRHYGDEDDHVVVARWFHRGENIDKVVTILNRNMKYERVATRFECLEMDLRNRPFHRIMCSIDEGLRVMLGWDTEDYGCHAVLVTGYYIGKEKWLRVNDPGGTSNEVSWDSLTRSGARAGPAAADGRIAAMLNRLDRRTGRGKPGPRRGCAATAAATAWPCTGPASWRNAAS